MVAVFIDAMNDILGLDIQSLAIDRTRCNEEKTNSRMNERSTNKAQFVLYESNNNGRKLEETSKLPAVESLAVVANGKIERCQRQVRVYSAGSTNEKIIVMEEESIQESWNYNMNRINIQKTLL